MNHADIKAGDKALKLAYLIASNPTDNIYLIGESRADCERTWELTCKYLKCVFPEIWAEMPQMTKEDYLKECET